LSSFSISAQSELQAIIPIHENPDFMILQNKRIKETKIYQMASAEIQYFIIKSYKDTYSYIIFLDGHLIIEQKTIPSLSGNLGFRNTNDAAKVAEHVIKKMKDGEMPPTLNENDLKQINIIHQN